jgi:predicted dehydrogenase
VSDDTTRCIIVGMGGITAQMLPVLGVKPWFVVAGIMDVRDDALAGTQATLALPDKMTFGDLGQALAECDADAAIINTPSELHYAQTRAALEVGMHVLVAKPITNNHEQAVELVELAKARGVTLSVGQQLRYNRHYTALKRFVESGRLGPVEAVFFMNSKPRPNPANLAEMDQPALYENACHHFDTFQEIFEDHVPEWVSCDGFVPSWSPYAGPTMVNALIRWSDGLHMLYHGGFASQGPMYEFRLEGSRGALRCRGIHMSNDTMDYEFAPPLGRFEPVAIDAGIPAREPWSPFLDVWRDYVRGGPEPPFSGRNNLKVFALLSAAIDSVNTRQPVAVANNPRYAGAFR